MYRSPKPRQSRSIGRVISALVFAAAPLRAGAAAFPDETYHSLPCRPTIACTADFVPPGVVELEMGYIYRRLGIGANQHSAPFLLKLTLADWVQFQFGSNGVTRASQPAPAFFFDDVTFGLKFHLVDQSDYFPSLSFSTTASVPTVAAEGYLRTYDLFLVAYATKDIRWLHADLNLGANLWRLEKPVSTQAWAALALSVQLPHGLGLMLEGYSLSNAAPISPSDAGLLTGLSFAPSNWVVLDIGVDVSLVPSTRSASAFIGFSIIPLDLWDTDAERQARAARFIRHER